MTRSIDVWIGSADPERLDRPWDAACLSPEERARAQRFHFPRDAHAYTLGKRMTRTVLGQRLGIPPARVAFQTSDHGKPRLAPDLEESGVTFNLAHSGFRVLLAVAHRRRVGVDVELQRVGPDIQALAERFFCPREAALLAASNSEEQRRLFFKYWTLKEAYLKAEGSGLSLSLKAVDVSGNPDATLHPPFTPVEDKERGFRLQRLDPGDGYAAALCADGEPWTTHVHPWNVEDWNESSG